MKLSPQAERVLEQLKSYQFSGVGSSEVSRIPAPSVRRAVAELKAAGHMITRDGRFYYLKS